MFALEDNQSRKTPHTRNSRKNTPVPETRPSSRTPLDVRRSRSGLPNRCAMDAEETDREAVTAKMGAEGGKVDDFLFEIA